MQATSRQGEAPISGDKVLGVDRTRRYIVVKVPHAQSSFFAGKMQPSVLQVRTWFLQRMSTLGKVKSLQVPEDREDGKQHSVDVDAHAAHKQLSSHSQTRAWCVH